MLAQKTGDSFFEIDFSRKCYAENRSSVTLYKICGESGYINLGKVFQGTIMECKQFVFDKMCIRDREYSNSKADFIRENYTEFDGYGVEYNTLEELFEMSVNKKTPRCV